MVVKIYGFIYSIATQRVVLVLKALNVPFELVVVDMTKGEHKTAEYVTKQPFGLVPFMDDDGFQLFESRAICRYIVSKYGSSGTSLLPTELKVQALFEQAVSIEIGYFESPAMTIYYEKILAKYFGKETDNVQYEQALKKMEAVLDVYETTLAKQKYLAGDEITLADFFHIPLGNAVHLVVPDMLLKWPNVTRWWEDISARPASLATIEAVKGGGFPELDRVWQSDFVQM